MFKCQLLTTGAEMDAIADEWRDLHARVGRTPFSDYDWVRCWWNTMSGIYANSRLVVVIGRQGKELAGVLPLFVSSRMGLRFLYPAGYKVFHFCEMLAGDTAQAIELWTAAKNAGGYDIADLRDVYPGTLAYEALSRVGNQRDVTKAYYLNFKFRSGREWFSSLSAKIQSGHRKHLKKLEENGVVTFDVIKDAARAAEFVAHMVEEKASAYQARDRHGVLEYPEFIPYLRAQITRAADQERLLLFVLRCDGRAIAYNLCFPFAGVVQGYFMTHDHEWARYSPGRVLIIKHLEWCFDHGYTGYNFMHGGGDYKQSYVNETVDCPEFTFAGSVPGRILERAFLVARNIKRRLSHD
jgi:CelD/BcsL family acetyltransferase involved in cellulose biosynthesis